MEYRVPDTRRDKQRDGSFGCSAPRRETVKSHEGQGGVWERGRELGWRLGCFRHESKDPREWGERAQACGMLSFTLESRPGACSILTG